MVEIKKARRESGMGTCTPIHNTDPTGWRTGVSQAFVAQRVVLADNNIGGGREDEILLALSGVGEQGKLMR